MNLKKLFHFHKWEIIQDGNYDTLGIPSPSTIRKCKKCEVKQKLVIDCLGMNPQDYYRFWQTIEETPDCFKSNPSYQMQAENCCNDCPYRKECL